MKKYTLEELIEKDMIMIPEVDMSFMLGDVRGYNIEGLQEAGGVYLMIHEPTEEILYVGVSRRLGQRMIEHKATRRKGSLKSKITEALGDVEADKQINNEAKVHIILESDENYQEIFENVLIKKYNPVYNIVGKQGGRGATKGHRVKVLPIKEIIEKYRAGKSAYALGKEYGVSAPTITNRLEDAGEPIREKDKDLPMNEIVVKYLAGKGTVLLGKEYGVSHATIGRGLKGAGVALHINKTKRKQLNAHIINAFDAEQRELYTSELKALELNTLELAGA